jgi:hypothetical protein
MGNKRNIGILSTIEDEKLKSLLDIDSIKI